MTYNNHRLRSNCRKHPKHRQSPGVCSLCLSEKLSQLSSYSGYSRPKVFAKSPSTSSSLSNLSPLSSSDASSCSSPVGRYTRAGRTRRVFKSTTRDVLQKSRSTAFVLQWRRDEDDRMTKTGNRGGFWSKLLPRRNKGLMMHSRTTRERAITAIH